MKSAFVFIFMVLTLKMVAQQDPQYTQYMYNMNIINPAYAGSADGLAIGLLYRSQWVGLDGSPRTLTFTSHSPISEHVGLGISLITDEIGPVKETSTYIDFSYTISINTEMRLSFGLKGGFTFHDVGISESQITIIDPGDPFFQNNINETTPNIGAGIYLYKPNRFYASVSMPNMLDAVHLDYNGLNIGTETQHLFTAAGYVFDLSKNFKLKPHILLKYAFDAPVSFDINANLFIYNLVEIGIGYRLDDSFTGMVNFLITPNLKIGYAYDNIQSELNFITNSSHEVFLNFHLNSPKRRVRSPRYF